jgi:peroxiredoxin
LLDFENNAEYFHTRDVHVAAASADDLEHARDTVRTHKLTLTVGYGLDPRHVSALTGAFYSRGGGYLHATGFVLDPRGIIYNAVYSCRSIGRLSARDCIGLIDFSR